jgi:hypothetical protein
VTYAQVEARKEKAVRFLRESAMTIEPTKWKTRA